MEIFIDSAKIEEVKEAVDLGIVDGVTTNPTWIAASGKKFPDVINEIYDLIKKPINVQVTATNYLKILSQARKISQLNEKIIVKIPAIPEGIKAIGTLSQEGIRTNLTLVCSPMQAFLAAKLGANYVSPFVGRLDKISLDGSEIIKKIRTIFDNYDYKTKILVAGPLSPLGALEGALIGADAVTMKLDILKRLYDHPLTDRGLKNFLLDWKNANLSEIE